MNVTCFGFLVMFTCELPATPPPVVVCPQAPAWSKERQARLADELQSLPANAELKAQLKEHVQLRDILRKCRARKGTSSPR